MIKDRLRWIQILSIGIMEATQDNKRNLVIQYSESIRLLSYMSDDFIKRNINNILIDIKEIQDKYMFHSQVKEIDFTV